MRRAVLIVLMILVASGIGIVIFMQFVRTHPIYAGSEKNVIYEGNSLCASSKYYIGLEPDEVNIALEDVEYGVEGANTAYNAILAKGTPIFNPTFYINVTDSGTDHFRISGEAVDELLEGQQQLGFFCSDLQLNVYTDGASQILSMRSIVPNELVARNTILPVITEDGLEGSLVCNETSFYDINFAFLDENTTTTVTFEWKYDVRNSTPLNLSSLTEQTLVVDVIFTYENGVLSAKFA